MLSKIHLGNPSLNPPRTSTGITLEITIVLASRISSGILSGTASLIPVEFFSGFHWELLPELLQELFPRFLQKFFPRLLQGSFRNSFGNFFLESFRNCLPGFLNELFQNSYRTPFLYSSRDSLWNSCRSV